MNNELNLKELEKKAYKSTFQDGLWDIYLGQLLLTPAIASIGDMIPLSEPFNYFILLIPFYILAILILFLGKRYITVPRLGFVKFGARRKRAKKYMILFTILNTLFLIIILVLTITGILTTLRIERYGMSLLFGFIFIWLPLSIVAFIIKFNKFYIYAIMGGLSFFTIELVYPFVGEPLDSILVFGIIGNTIIFVGIIYLIKFLKKYPSPKKEMMKNRTK